MTSDAGLGEAALAIPIGMNTRRTAKVAQAIRQVVSSAILIELRDPRVKNVTVVNVEVPADLRSAKIYVSILGDEKAARLALQGLGSARGWLQSKIADEIDLRYTPILSFVVDEGVKKSIAAAKLLREIQIKDGVLPPDSAETESEEAEEEAPDDLSEGHSG
jgi:ribosome-binding factor A